MHLALPVVTPCWLRAWWLRACGVLAMTCSASGATTATAPMSVPAAPAAPALRAASPQCRAIGLSSCPQPFDAVLPAARDMLTWDEPTRVVGFRNTYRLYPADVFRTLGGTVYPLPAARHPLPPLHYRMDGHTLGLAGYLARQHVSGLLILKHGRVAYEYYGRGNTPNTLWTSRSVAKSVVSILVGIAIKEGAIGSVDDPVIRYVPELRGTAWQDVTLRNLLQHTSGIAWTENYADPSSDFAQLTQCEAGPNPYDCVLELIRTRTRRPGVLPGAVWSYNTGGAWLLGRLLERATGTTLAHYLESRIWSRFAMQSDGVWESVAPGEADMGGHGFNATLRDWGRFGLFVAGGGKLPSGEVLLPQEWLAQSTTWTTAKGSVTPSAPTGQYGYQWWFGSVNPARAGAAAVLATSRGTLWAEGIYGQAIAVNPKEQLVMVQWSTWNQAEGPDSLYDEQAIFFAAVAQALAPRARAE
jgi:CubicO group peptidase (beta-lactamase class C family)